MNYVHASMIPYDGISVCVRRFISLKKTPRELYTKMYIKIAQRLQSQKLRKSRVKLISALIIWSLHMHALCTYADITLGLIKLRLCLSNC